MKEGNANNLLRIIKSPRNSESKPIEKRKDELQKFAKFIFDKLSEEYSISYIADVADNFYIRRGVNLVFQENKDGTRIYQYAIGGKILYMIGEKEIDFMASVLMKLVYQKKEELERKTGKKIIL